MPKILLVEDQVLTAHHIKNILNDSNFNKVEMAHKINQAIEILNELEQSNKKLRMELMKYSVHGGFDEVYLEMKKRNLLT